MCNLAIKDIEWMRPSDTTFGSGAAAAKKLFPRTAIVLVCEEGKRNKRQKRGSIREMRDREGGRRGERRKALTQNR